MASFVDTNIFVYALSSANQGEAEKVDIAKRLVARLMEQRDLVLSAQVLGEFVSVAARKANPPLSTGDLSKIIGTLLEHTVIPVDASLVQTALQRMQQSRISYWDAQIVEAAIRSGASVLYTEDLHSGTVYGGVEVRNPFK